MLNQRLKPMLLRDVIDGIPTGTEWLHQVKLDGHRALVHFDHGNIRIFTRHENEVTRHYPELQALPLHADTCILDGEAVVLDPNTTPPKPCFESLMTRFHASKETTIHRLMMTLPIHFSAFDVLFYNGQSLLKRPLKERITILDKIIPDSPFISQCSWYTDGQALFDRVKELGMEGTVSKQVESFYCLGARSPSGIWLRRKAYQYATVQIAGLRKDKFGWMLQIDGRYVGVLEFAPRAEKIAFFKIAKQLVKKETKDWFYLDPVIRANVKFQCFTRDGLMRTPSFVEFVV